MTIVPQNTAPNQSALTDTPPTLAELSEAKCLPLATLAGLGWRDSFGGIVIPYLTREGTLFRTRIRCRLTGGDKYRWGQGAGSCAYGLELLDEYAKANPEYLLLVEGETDCAALWYDQFAAIGLPGNTMQNCLDLWMAKPFESVVIWQEPDASGVTFRDRTVERLKRIGYAGKVRVIDAAEAGAKDPCELRGLNPKHFRRTMEELILNARTLPNATEVPKAAYSVKTLQDPLLRVVADSLQGSESVQHRSKPSFSGGDFVGANGGPKVKPICTIETITASEVVPEPVQWLIPGWLPKKELTLVCGEARAGKSTILYSIIADITRGRACLGLKYRPDGPEDVLLVSVEDHPGSKIVPFVAAADGDLARLHIVTAAKDAKGEAIRLDLDQVAAFRSKMLEKRAKVLILDPVASLLPGGADDNSDAGVRAVIDPLAEMAAELGIAVLMVKHVGKSFSTVSNAHLGSGAWRSRARACWIIMRGEESQRYLFDNGSSLAIDQVGRMLELSTLEGEDICRIRLNPPFREMSEKDFLALTVPLKDEETGAAYCGGILGLRWKGRADTTPAELIEAKRVGSGTPKEGSAKDCAEWIREHLSEGYAYFDTEVATAADRAGFSARQYRAGKNILTKAEVLTSKMSGAAGSPWLIGFASSENLRKLNRGSLTVSQSDSPTRPAQPPADSELVSNLEPVETLTDSSPAFERLSDCQTVKLPERVEDPSEIPVELLSNSGRLVL